MRPGVGRSRGCSSNADAGLLALIRLHQARAAAPFDDAGRIIQLPDQDRRLWDAAAIEEAGGLIARAAAHRRPGPYQLQAAIVACHAEAKRWEDTDWPQILVLYTGVLDGYHLYHATRAELLHALGQSEAARAADARALTLTANPAEIDLLRQRLQWR